MILPVARGIWPLIKDQATDSIIQIVKLLVINVNRLSRKLTGMVLV